MGTYREFVETDYGGVGRSCLAKARFDSRREACALARQGRRSNGQLDAYHCVNCSYWHLGHRRSPKSKRALMNLRRRDQPTWTTTSAWSEET